MAIKRKIRLLAWNFSSSYQHINIGFDASLYESPNPTSAIFTDKLFTGTESEDVSSIYLDRFPDTQARLDYTVGEYTVTTAAEFSDLNKVPCENICNSSRLSESAEYIHFTGCHNLRDYYFNNGVPASVGLAVFQQEKYYSLYPSIVDCAEKGGFLYTVCGTPSPFITYAMDGVFMEWHKSVDEKLGVLVLKATTDASVVTITANFLNVDRVFTKTLDGTVAAAHVTHCQFSPDNLTLSVMIDAIVRKNVVIEGVTLEDVEHHNIFDVVIHLEIIEGILQVSQAENDFSFLSEGVYSLQSTAKIDINFYANERLFLYHKSLPNWTYAQTNDRYLTATNGIKHLLTYSAIGTSQKTTQFLGSGIKKAYVFNEDKESESYLNRNFVTLENIGDTTLTSNETFNFVSKETVNGTPEVGDDSLPPWSESLFGSFDWDFEKTYSQGKIELGLVANNQILNKVGNGIYYFSSDKTVQKNNYFEGSTNTSFGGGSTVSAAQTTQELYSISTDSPTLLDFTEDAINYRAGLSLHTKTNSFFTTYQQESMELEANLVLKTGAVTTNRKYSSKVVLSSGAEAVILENNEAVGSASEVSLGANVAIIAPKIFNGYEPSAVNYFTNFIGVSGEAVISNGGNSYPYLYHIESIGGIAKVDDNIYVASSSFTSDISPEKNKLWVGEIVTGNEILDISNIASKSGVININDNDDYMFFGLAQ